MSEDTRALYQYLGMDDLLPEGGVIASGAAGHDPLRRAVDAAEVALERDPGPLLAALGRVWEGDPSPELLAAYTEQARLALADPLVTRIQLQRIDRTRGGLASSGKPLPDGFDFPYRTDLIPIDPERRKFEEYADWFRWFLHGVRWWGGENLPFIPRVVKAPFRWHNHPAHASRFIYEEPAAGPGSPLRIALFSDFGTGEYQSQYIAEQLTCRHTDMAFHLGDVYYAGQRDELVQYFTAPLSRYASTRPLYVLNENHEMMSGGRHYFDYLDQKRAWWGHTQRQEGSYFAVRRPPLQVVGIDTVWHEQGRWQQPALLSWLESVLREGRERGLVNILLSGQPPYAAGNQDLRALLERDLRPLERAGLIDLWFWGHHHYCALFDRTERTRFIGSCIGHGGFPVKRAKNEQRYHAAAGRDDMPAPMLFFERRARFPAWTGVRQDMSNHGYAVLHAASACELELTYHDWMGYRRCTCVLERSDPRAPMRVRSVIEHDEG